MNLFSPKPVIPMPGRTTAFFKAKKHDGGTDPTVASAPNDDVHVTRPIGGRVATGYGVRHRHTVTRHSLPSKRPCCCC